MITKTKVEEEASIALRNIPWIKYEGLLSLLGDEMPTLRLNYLEETLEIMTTSRLHEEIKSTIRMLLESYFFHKGIHFFAIGSATFKKESQKRGLEADECYCFDEKKDYPDLAIEVVLTSGWVDKLEIYRGLEIPEVWFWKENKFYIHKLINGNYQILSNSELLPDLDIELLANYVQPENQYESVKKFREELER